MATKGATKRLSKEYMLIQQSPPPFLIAKPIESNILEWHYVLRGPPDTPYEGGEYHGKLVFPGDYPFKPPSIRMTTPSGRFQTDTKLCLSMSDFHPGSWNPSWSVATILTGLLSFMTANESTTGSIKTSDADKRIYAARSHEFNLKNRKFMELFPELCTPQLAPLPPINGTSSSTQEGHDKSSTPNPEPISIATPKTTITTTTATTTTTTVTQRTAAPASSREPQRAVFPTTDRNRDTRWFSFEPWHKILVFTAVCLYLLATKVMSRSSGLS